MAIQAIYKHYLSKM